MNKTFVFLVLGLLVVGGVSAHLCMDKQTDSPSVKLTSKELGVMPSIYIEVIDKPKTSKELGIQPSMLIEVVEK